VRRALANHPAPGALAILAFAAVSVLAGSLLASCSHPVTIEPRSPTRSSTATPASSPAPGLRSDGAGRGPSGAESERPASPSNSEGAAAAPTVPAGAEPWSYDGADGRVYVTASARIHSTLAVGSLDRALPSFVERAVSHYRTALCELPAPRDPLETYIFGTRSQWERHTRERLGSSAGPYLAMGKGGFTTEGDAILYDIGPLDTLTIIAHEGWHQYTQRTFKQPLPLWLEEGVACWMEAVRPGRGQSASSPFMPWRNHERFSELRNGARRGDLIPLEALLDSSPEQFLRQGKDRMLLYYAQVWALVHFLREGENGRYAEALRTLLLDASEGTLHARMQNSQIFPNSKARSMHLQSRVGKWVLLEYFNPRFSEFKDQYEKFLKQVTQPSAAQRVWQGESPAQAPPAN